MRFAQKTNSGGLDCHVTLVPFGGLPQAVILRNEEPLISSGI